MFAAATRNAAASIGVYFDVMWLTFLGISILIQYMYNDNACLDLLLAFFMLFASIHLGSTTTTTIIISSLINKKKMIRLLPVHNARRAAAPCKPVIS